MRDLFFVAFLAAMVLLAVRRPFLFVLGYCYVDIVAPQRLSYYLLNQFSLSLAMFGLAFASWLIADRKRDMRFDHLLVVLLMLFAYCGWTTMHADFPVDAPSKWSWVWKALVWAMFLPLVLRTRLRIEALLLTMVLAASALAITGGIKTALGGGGYGSLQLLLDDNSGLFEGSIFSTVAIAIIPIILWLARHGTIFPSLNDRRVWVFAIALVGACLLIPIGTQARTGLVCAAMLGLLGLRESKRRLTYITGIGAALLVALPLVPVAFAARMDTITNYRSDESASTRLAVWAWTWNYALENPLGGGFEAYRGNELRVDRIEETGSGAGVTRRIIPYTDRARAYHNSYFEMLGEQGFIGLALWLYLHVWSIIRMERIRRRYVRAHDDDAWVRPLATALQYSHLVYMLGSMFVGIAFQPFIYMLLAAQIALWTYLARREKEAQFRPIAASIGAVSPPARGITA